MTKTPAAGKPPHGCGACRHYFITHDAAFPYGCRIHGLKSRRPPSQDVRAATGRDCLAHEARIDAPDRQAQAIRK